MRGPAAAQRYEALTTDTERLQQLVDEIRDLVAEDFRDGHFTCNPAWVADGGEFFVSRRDGLHSYADPSRLALTPPTPRTRDRTQDTVARILRRIITEAVNEDEDGGAAPAPTQ